MTNTVLRERALVKMKTVFILTVYLLAEASSQTPLQLDPLVRPERGIDDDESFATFVEGVRLPRDVIPLHYDLQIRPILDLTEGAESQFTAPGRVTIRLLCSSTTDVIVIHSRDTDIETDAVTVITAQDSNVIPISDHSVDSPLMFYKVHLGNVLTVGEEYILTIPFTSKVSGERLSGLYRSSYIDDMGNQRWLATTHFQKPGARLAFPCFDEPNFRSTFNITIGRTKEHISLSNSVIRETHDIGGMPGWEWDIYDRTVSMPTYLVAIIVSDFIAVSAPEGISEHDVKIWGPPSVTNVSTAGFAAKASAEILSFFETYFDSKYQFTKLDSAAIPDFSAGAMENWALNTYRYLYLLWFDWESTEYQQLFVGIVVAHEVSHHWFGNLVTCDWWNDLWLNEGFAQYMELIGANATIPDSGVIDRYTIDDLQLAMAFDAGPQSEPIHSNRTDIVNAQPSRIVYEKGASLVKMMQGFLGENTLMKGLQNYLNKYAYQNTVQDDLFAELHSQAVTNGWNETFTVKDVMDTWTLQTGFPVVTLHHAGGSAVFITQQKFNPNYATVNPIPGTYSETWYIPVSYTTKSNPDFTMENLKPKFWLDKFTLSKVFILPSDIANNWIVLNTEATGYYRVLYDDHYFRLILSQLGEDHTVIGLSSRSQLFDDYFKSAFAGYADLENALDLLSYLGRETENTVWTSVFNNLRSINGLLQDDLETYKKLKDFVVWRITSSLSTIGWRWKTDERSVDVILRTQLLDWACSLGDWGCILVTFDYLQRIGDWSEKVPADYHPMIFCKAMNMGDSFPPSFMDIRKFLREEYAKATRAERKMVFVNAMGCEVANSVPGVIDELINGTNFSDPHAVQIIQKMAENPLNRNTVLSYLGTRFTDIVDRFNESAISSIVSSIAASTSDSDIVDQANEIIELGLDVLKDETVKASLRASANKMEDNKVWMRSHGETIRRWVNAIENN